MRGAFSRPCAEYFYVYVTHGTYGLRYVFCASVFCAYSVFSDKQNTVQSFEGASVLCNVYCAFRCQSVFTPGERLT